MRGATRTAGFVAACALAFSAAFMLASSPAGVDLVSMGGVDAEPLLHPGGAGGAADAQEQAMLHLKSDAKRDMEEAERQAAAYDAGAQGNALGVPDTSEANPIKRRQQNSWRLIILYQHNFNILWQAVKGYQRASHIMVPNTIIVDNSAHEDALNNKTLRGMVSEVVKTPRPLNFPQLHNFMATLALERRLDFYFWAHSDNYVLAGGPGRDLGKDALDCLLEVQRKTPNWGLIFFAYDHLAAFRTRTMVQVPWDPHVFQYGSECDAYGRIKQARYEVKACKVHKSFDMKVVLPIADKDSYERAEEILEADKLVKGRRNDWRELQMSAEEQGARKRMKAASRLYLAAKWGELSCKVKNLPCSKPWPYCIQCPEHLPQCLDKGMGFEQLDAIHREAHRVFDSDPDQPVALTQ